LDMLEINERTGDLQIDTTGVSETVLGMLSLIFWWVVFTFGTEWWLKRKWLPKHVIQDEVEQ